MIQVNHHGAITLLVRYEKMAKNLGKKLLRSDATVKYLGFGIYLELLYFYGSNVSTYNDYNYNHDINDYHNKYHNNHNNHINNDNYNT